MSRYFGDIPTAYPPPSVIKNGWWSESLSNGCIIRYVHYNGFTWVVDFTFSK